MSWLYYLLEANIYLAVFYACYCLFLNKETHYTLNRVYLLLTCMISFILPVTQVGVLQPTEVVQHVYANAAVSAPAAAVVHVVNYKPEVLQITLQDIAWYIYLAGAGVLSLLLIIKVARLIKMTTKAKKLAGNPYRLIGIEGSNTAFSFFNYLFIGTKTAGSELIIQHELVHIRQKHSLDVLFIEMLRIVNWFNPIIYLIQISVKTVHEYIADEQTATRVSDALIYSSFLVDNAYGIGGPSVTHSFFNYNLLKKRIIMLNQQRSSKLARLKYLVAVPICAGMLCASTLAFSKNYALIDLAPKHHQLKSVTLANVALKIKPQKNASHLPQVSPPVSAKPANIPAAPTEINEATKLPPPPAPPVGMQADTSGNDANHTLVKYIAKYTRYPAVDYEKHIGGRVIATFEIVDGKITNPEISRSVEPIMDGELLRVLKKYDGTLSLQNGHYAIPVSFQLIDAKNNQVAHLPKNYSNATAAKPAKPSNGFSTSLMLDEVVIVGYTKD